MKKIYFPVIVLVLFSLVSGLLVSCKKNSFLAANNTTNLTQTVIFTDSAYTVGFLANIYANTEFSPSPARFTYLTLAGVNQVCGGLDAASDESEVSHTYSTTALAFAIGSIDENNVTDDAYKTCYAQIRAVNQLYKNIGTAPLQSGLKTEMLAEARFLRAYYYFILLEHYGGVPIVGYSVYDYTKPVPATRSTFAQTVTYITSQLDSAYASLPLNQSGENLGRASGGACLALKARVLLYAASPLYNPSNSAQAQATPAGFYGSKNAALTQYTTNDAASVLNRWNLAKTAAYNVVTLGLYRLFTDSVLVAGYGEEGAFQLLFTVRTNNPEYIFANNTPYTASALPANFLEGLFNPPSRTGGGGAYPYQSTVDAFPMHNGKDITDPTSGYNPANPYANRDPRLRYSIVYNGALLPIRESNGTIPGYSPIFIGLDVVNGTTQAGSEDAVHQGTLTGYYNNKMVDPQAVANAGLVSATQRTMPILRYAEMLLDYAEAANEVSGPTDSIYTALELIRARAGISPGTATDGFGNLAYGLTPSMTQAQMRTAIQKERRIELAYEGHRFFDVRRWLTASNDEAQPEYGMEVDTIKTGSTVTAINYNQFLVRKHNFTTRMYLWPFPQSEVGKGQGLIQNPGY
jgi:starch-binding outer membrane protein, SusD/RagB family